MAMEFKTLSLTAHSDRRGVIAPPSQTTTIRSADTSRRNAGPDLAEMRMVWATAETGSQRQIDVVDLKILGRMNLGFTDKQAIALDNIRRQRADLKQAHTTIAVGGTELPMKFPRGSATKRRKDGGQWTCAAVIAAEDRKITLARMNEFERI